MRYLYYLEIKFKWIFGDFMFRACGVNPTLQLTRGHYTRNMAVWYIRNMGGLRSCFTAVFVRLLSIPFASAGGGGDSRCSAMATWMSQRVRRSRQTNTQKNRLRCSRFAPRDCGNRGLKWSPGGRNSRRMKHQGKKANVTPRRKWSVWCNAASGVIEVPEVDREGWAE